MAFCKRKTTFCHMTESDRERIRKLDDTPEKTCRKFKALETFKHKAVKAEICKYIYGKDKDELKEKAKADLVWFSSKDKSWKLANLEILKGESQDSE